MCIPNPLSKNDIRVNIDVTGRSTTAAAQTQNYFNYVYEVRVSRWLRNFNKIMY